MGGDGAEVDDAAGAVVFGDDAGAVLVEFGEGEAGAVQAGGGVVGEEGVVAAGGLGAAFEDVSGDDGSGEAVVVVGCPAEVGDGGSGDEGGVGDASGDDDVGAFAEAGGDADAAEVGVRGEGAGVVAGAVVAFDVGDAGGDAEAVGEVADGVGEGGGVEAAGVGDDAYAVVVGEAEAFLELAQEGLGVAAAGVFEAVAAEDEHGEFGEVVAGEDVEGAAGEHVAQGVEAVAVEAGGVADAQGLRVRVAAGAAGVTGGFPRVGVRGRVGLRRLGRCRASGRRRGLGRGRRGRCGGLVG